VGKGIDSMTSNYVSVLSQISIFTLFLEDNTRPVRIISKVLYLLSQD